MLKMLKLKTMGVECSRIEAFEKQVSFLKSRLVEAVVLLKTSTYG